MNSKLAKRAMSQTADINGIPYPSPDLVAQANTILRLCEELDATRTQIHATEQTYRRAQRTLVDAEQRRDQNGALADTLAEVAAAKEALMAAEKVILQHRRRLPTIESELHKFDGEFAAAVPGIIQPLRAQAAQHFRDAVAQAKQARDEFVGLGDAAGGQDQHAMSITIGDLEDGRDLMYERNRERPEFVRQWWPIRLAMRAAERS